MSYYPLPGSTPLDTHLEKRRLHWIDLESAVLPRVPTNSSTRDCWASLTNERVDSRPKRSLTTGFDATALCIKVALFVLMSISLCTQILSHMRTPAEATTEPFSSTTPALAVSNGSLISGLPQQRIFIASVVSGKRGVEGSWGRAMKELIEALGSENVFFSATAGDRSLETQQALDQLQRTLPCPKSFSSGHAITLADLPHVTFPDGSKRVKKSVYHAALRNQALRPLDRVSLASFDSTSDPLPASTKFDKILFVDDDVDFRLLDALRLIFKTNYMDEYHSAVYEVACSNGPAHAAESSIEPNSVPVKVCWGAMNVIDAKNFQGKNPLRFRASTSSTSDAHPACLLHEDLAQRYQQRWPRALNFGVFVNTEVQVAMKSRRRKSYGPAWQSTLRWLSETLRRPLTRPASGVTRLERDSRSKIIVRELPKENDSNVAHADDDPCATSGFETVSEDETGWLFAKHDLSRGA